MISWDTYFIEMAKLVSTKSKDGSTKVGCVLVGPDKQVLTTGFNGFPRGVCESVDGVPERHERPAKYGWTEHAERNAIFNAARHGISTRGAVAYLNYAPYPCEQCMRALIQAGIREIVGPPIPFPGVGNGTYYSTDSITPVMALEAGVILRVGCTHD